MEGLRGVIKPYAWGSTTAIPGLFDLPPSPTPVAEIWLGTHPAGPSDISSGLVYEPDATRSDRSLAGYVAADPAGCLGAELAQRSTALPYLVKLIAPARPLSLQVHPTAEQAASRFAAEEAAGIPLDAPHRCYRDTNHKPELLFALTEFETLAGFRAPRRVLEVLAGLGGTVAERLHHYLSRDLTRTGVKAAFEYLLTGDMGPGDLADLAERCTARYRAGKSPSVRADRIVSHLAEHYPCDPGIAAALLLNPVSLAPGEALFIPAGTVHAYLSGTGIEIMANSDNVLRAGLTAKHIDVPELLATVDYTAAPPVRIAPERVSRTTRTYYAPVDEFELSVSHLKDWTRPELLAGHGPRIVLTVSGAARVSTNRGTRTLNRGQAAFVRADEGPLSLQGVGMVVTADVP
ncbi:MAG: mannose-6-phosphate isomerase, class I [Flaviflexus sp.]|nr:mannose-6-phosphate isomerase, class I [Flaviflexus sp.]